MEEYVIIILSLSLSNSALALFILADFDWRYVAILTDCVIIWRWSWDIELILAYYCFVLLMLLFLLQILIILQSSKILLFISSWVIYLLVEIVVNIFETNLLIELKIWQDRCFSFVFIEVLWIDGIANCLMDFKWSLSAYSFPIGSIRAGRLLFNKLLAIVICLWRYAVSFHYTLMRGCDLLFVMNLYIFE